MKNRGFTLIELIVFVVMLSALLLVIASKYDCFGSNDGTAVTTGDRSLPIAEDSDFRYRYPVYIKCFNDDGIQIFFQNASSACYNINLVTGDKIWMVKTDGNTSTMGFKCNVTCKSDADSDCGEECQ